MRVKLLSQKSVPSTGGNVYMVEYEQDAGGGHILVSTAGSYLLTLIRMPCAVTA